MASYTVIEWNISYNAKPDKIISMLLDYMHGKFIITLLEVVPNAFEAIKNAFDKSINYSYSLDYRAPGKFDGRNRKLGIMLLTSKDIDIVESGVFERALLPDRTFYAVLQDDVNRIKIASFHSITGCEHRKAKSINYLSCTEAVDEFKPDIVTIDANEPDIDHYDIRQTTFFDKNGRGARTFFYELDDIGLVDSYAVNYDPNDYIEGKPLAVSHKIKGHGTERRYDFVFVKKDKFDAILADYEYQRAIEASADHALVCVRLEFN